MMQLHHVATMEIVLKTLVGLDQSNNDLPSGKPCLYAAKLTYP